MYATSFIHHVSQILLLNIYVFIFMINTYLPISTNKNPISSCFNWHLLYILISTSWIYVTWRMEQSQTALHETESHGVYLGTWTMFSNHNWLWHKAAGLAMHLTHSGDAAWLGRWPSSTERPSVHTRILFWKLVKWLYVS